MATTIEIEIAPGDDGLEAFEVLRALGAAELELFDDVPPARLVALFAGDDVEGLRAALAAHSIEGRVRTAAQVDLGASWREGLRPVRYGPLWVAPRGLASPGAPAIVIECEGAFGSGHHETTALCLERIVELGPRGDVLDIGTGSGVLALAALTLGARSALGTDIEPRALERAEENARENGLAGRFRTTTAEADALGRRFDLVVANIIGSWLIELAPRIVAAVDTGGDLMLSGVRPGEADAIARIYRDLGLRVLGRDTKRDWVRLDFTPSW